MGWPEGLPGVTYGREPAAVPTLHPDSLTDFIGLSGRLKCALGLEHLAQANAAEERCSRLTGRIMARPTRKRRNTACLPLPDDS